MIEPTEEQKAILNAPEKNILVIARPGRGKTTTALLLAQQIIERKQMGDAQQVLFLTFSRNSVYQIKHASSRNLNIEIRKRLLIATYHSFMWWLISSFGRFHGLPPKLGVMGVVKTRAARAVANQADIESNQQGLFFAKTFCSISYDEFAPIALDLLSGSTNLCESIQHRFPIIIVDEFQDTNSEQWNFIKLISDRSRLICFADPDQMIYSWRGACEDRLEQFIDELQAKEYNLQEKCMRTDQNDLLNFAESILDNKHAKSQVRRTYKRRFLRSYKWPNALGYYLKNIIREFHEDFQGKSNQKDGPTIALAAYSNADAREIQRLLGKPTKKAPKTYRCCILQDDIDDSLKELIIHLAIWIARSDQNEVEQAIQLIGGMLTSDFSKASGPIKSLANPKRLIEGGDNPRDTAKVIIEEVMPKSQSTITSDKEAIDEAIEIINRLRGRVKSISDAISESDLQTFQSEMHQKLENKTVDSVHSDLKMLQDGLVAERLQRDIIEQVKPPHGITSSTLHKLKGREFDYVCIVTRGKDKLRGAKASEKDARRLMYVALTRARYDARILYVESNPIFLLEPYLSKGFNEKITNF